MLADCNMLAAADPATIAQYQLRGVGLKWLLDSSTSVTGIYKRAMGEEGSPGNGGSHG